MVSVTRRCKTVERPSQYISMKNFEIIENKPYEVLYKTITISPATKRKHYL